MKIISWNCRGAFRNKFEQLTDFDADILIIQECENPAEYLNTKYLTWSNNYLWTGNTKHKGIGIFALKNLELKKLDWSNRYNDHDVKHFLPCVVNDKFQLLAVWTHKNNSPNFGYMGQFWKYLQVNKKDFKDILIIGDFNSNKIWDEWDRWWNHSDVVGELDELNIVSVYHDYFKEEQGKETKPTYFHHHNKDKSFHIDYVFAEKSFLSKKYSLSIGDCEKWFTLSDHLPLIFEFNN